MKRSNWVRRGLIGVVAILGIAAVGVVSPASTASPVVEAGTVPVMGAGGEFHAVTPARVFDSRSTDRSLDAVPYGKKPANANGAEFTAQLAGKGGLPADPSDILAVVANVTVVEPSIGGWLAIRPAGSTAGKTALVNFAAGRNVPNLAYVGVGPAGDVTVKIRTVPNGQAHVVIDVFGWISTTESGDRGARLITAGPARLLDTRTSGAYLTTDESRGIQVRGASSVSPVINPIVPASSNVTAVLVNIAAVNSYPSSRDTYLSATPSKVPAGAKSTTANLNVVAGQVKTGMAVVPIGPDGKIWIRNNFGNIHIVVDVFGYFQERPDETTVGRIIPLTAPFRALDTREAAFDKVPLGTGMVEDWSFKAFAESITIPTPTGSAPVGPQSALIGNLTGTGLERLYPNVGASTYLTAYPGNVSRPLVSNLNLAEGEDVPNMSLLRYGNVGGDPYVVKTYNYYGSLHYVLDVYAVVLS
ncbi:MAG: hypothetical protein WBP59_15320 [Ilumatobacteraceae bacterium]